MNWNLFLFATDFINFHGFDSRITKLLFVALICGNLCYLWQKISSFSGFANTNRQPCSPMLLLSVQRFRHLSGCSF